MPQRAEYINPHQPNHTAPHLTTPHHTTTPHHSTPLRTKHTYKMSIELASARLKSGANYLSQCQGVRPHVVALASPTGVSILRCGVEGLPAEEVVHLETTSEKGAVAALALCPVSPEMLATALSTAQSVLLWTTQPPDSPTCVSLDVGRGCRQLLWHPMRRVLAVLMPKKICLFECGGRAGSLNGPVLAPVTTVLQPEELTRGSLRCCSWVGEGGDTLAVAGDAGVFIVRWQLPGAWQRYTKIHLPFQSRHTCAVASSFDVLLMTISQPLTFEVAPAGGAVITEAAVVDHHGCGGTAAHLLDNDGPALPLDLRGRIGGATAPVNVLDLSAGTKGRSSSPLSNYLSLSTRPTHSPSSLALTTHPHQSCACPPSPPLAFPRLPLPACTVCTTHLRMPLRPLFYHRARTPPSACFPSRKYLALPPRTTHPPRACT